LSWFGIDSRSPESIDIDSGIPPSVSGAPPFGESHAASHAVTEIPGGGVEGTVGMRGAE
ncbi:MAG: hypothetical protein IH964_10585, partial [Candidatus Dadabacteria bacterium]|nr:hypothetical protein [Candidatus Dadabacteria bacterium]